MRKAGEVPRQSRVEVVVLCQITDMNAGGSGDQWWFLMIADVHLLIQCVDRVWQPSRCVVPHARAPNWLWRCFHGFMCIPLVIHNNQQSKTDAALIRLPIASLFFDFCAHPSHAVHAVQSSAHSGRHLSSATHLRATPSTKAG
jgi:hypothetical protein